MTGPDERIAELIQADIDGELPAQDRAELAAALDGSETAREFHAEMAKLAKLLADTPRADPPWGLRRRILDSIELPTPRRPSGWLRPASYGLALAAGVLIAVGVSRFSSQGTKDMSSLVGTMVSRGYELPNESASQLAINLAAIQGKVHLKSLDQAWALEFDLQSADPVEVAVDLGGSGLSFGGYANQDANAGTENLQVSGEQVRMMNEGSHRFVLFLRRMPERGSGSQQIGIAVSHQGETVYHGLLTSAG